MLRVTGAVMIITGCTGIGFWYRRKFHLALWHLRTMQRILEFFMSEIGYGKATLPECCLQVSGRVEEPYRASLIKIQEAFLKRDGVSFSDKWRSCMEEALFKIPVSREEKEIFLSFSAGSGLTDNRMQIRAIEQHRDMLITAILSREKDLEKQSRMAAGLGVMCGLLIAVILL